MLRFTCLLLLATISLGCSPYQNGSSDSQSVTDNTAAEDQSGGSNRFPVQLSTAHLPNAIQLHAKVISGGLPEGDAAFRELAALGVKTIISVDGAKPDNQTARKYGLRYVHLPHGYDGITETRALELAKAVRQLPGPFYIHCHHGKHRSPAAASVACISAGLVPPSQALAILNLAGTNPKYKGLFHSAQAARPIDSTVLDNLTVVFQETMAIPPMAEAMVRLEQAYDRLKLIAAADWSTPSNHPELDPLNEAVLLREQFTELMRTEEVQKKPSGFRECLAASEQAARQIETSLSDFSIASRTDSQAAALAAQRAQLDQWASTISDNCQSCHLEHRDNSINNLPASADH